MKAKITVGVVLAAIVIAAVLIFFPRKTAPEVRFTALSGENFSTSAPRGYACSSAIAASPTGRSST